MQAILRRLFLLMIIIPQMSPAMFLRRLIRPQIHNPRNYTHKYQSLEKQLKFGKADYVIMKNMEARNKKLQEKITAQDNLIAEFKKDPDAGKWWRAYDYYGDKLYWLERNVRMISSEKY